MTTTAPPPTTPDAAEIPEQLRALMTTEVAESLALEHGVCIRPLPMRTIDLETSEVRVVARACECRQSSVCPPCADKHRRLRIAQCREGWHLDHEPVTKLRSPAPSRRS
ncbi:MAG: replication initiator [Pseudonocardiaceae bacterium]